MVYVNRISPKQFIVDDIWTQLTYGLNAKQPDIIFFASFSGNKLVTDWKFAGSTGHKYFDKWLMVWTIMHNNLHSLYVIVWSMWSRYKLLFQASG